MSWAVVGANRETITAVVQTLVAHGFRASLHHLVHLPATLEHLRHTAYHAVIFLCEGRACCHSAPSVSAAPCSPACSASRSDAGRCPLRQLRATGNNLLVLAIAPPGHKGMACLDAGADGYLTTPYEPADVLTCVRALARRSSSATADKPQLRVGDLTLDLITRDVRRGGKQNKLSPREAWLLEYLMRHPGEVCTREQILKKAWGLQSDPGTNIVEQNVKRLRAKMDTGFDTRMIETVRGEGYRLSA